MKASIDVRSLRRLIAATKDFISHNSTRDTTRYIRLDFDSQARRVTAMAVDGYRLSTETAGCQADEDFSVYLEPVIPKCSINSIAEIELRDGFATVTVDGRMCGFIQPKGEPFDYKAVLAPLTPETPKFKIAFNTKYMQEALKAARYSELTNDRVVLEFYGETKPVLLRTTSDGIKMVLPIKM